VLETFCDTAVDVEEVRLPKSFESEAGTKVRYNSEMKKAKN